MYYEKVYLNLIGLSDIIKPHFVGFFYGLHLSCGMMICTIVVSKLCQKYRMIAIVIMFASILHGSKSGYLRDYYQCDYTRKYSTIKVRAIKRCFQN